MRKYIFIFTLSAIIFASCSSTQKKENIPDGYSLVWADEFDVDGAPDTTKWDYSTGGNGWGNAEVQFYTDKRDNSFVKNGKLHIVAKKDGSKWTSARLKTQYKGDWTYGYIEIRAKLPEGVGTWPAIWMMPRGDKYGTWPRSGEIDIMEHVGFDPDIIHTSIHTSAYNHKIGTHRTQYKHIKNVSKKFHTYAVKWEENFIEWYVDGELFYRFDNEHKTVAEWPFDIPFYLILNIAIGGSWGGQQGIDPKLTEAQMLIDYVRVYQKQ